MFVEKIPYVDFNGQEQVFVAHFNLTPAEILKLEMNNEGGLEGMVKSIIEEKDNERLYMTFEKIIKASYGKRSADNQRFIKNEDVFEEFHQCPAYSEFFVNLFMDPDYASKFIAATVPQIDSTESKPNLEVVKTDAATSNTENGVLR